MMDMDCLNKLNFYESKVGENLNFYQIIIFFLTKSYSRSERFEDELSTAKSSGIMITIVLLEEIKNTHLELNNFKVINMYELELKKDELKRLQIFLLRGLQAENYYFDNKTFYYWNKIRFNKVKKFYYDFKFSNILPISNDEIIFQFYKILPLTFDGIFNLSKGFKIMDVNTGSLISTIETNGYRQPICCWINHSNELFVIEKRFNESKKCEVYAKNSSFIRNLDISHLIEKDNPNVLIHSVFYDINNEKIYILHGYSSTAPFGVISALYRDRTFNIEVILNQLDLKQFSSLNHQIMNKFIYSFDDRFRLNDSNFHLFNLNDNFHTTVQIPSSKNEEFRVFSLNNQPIKLLYRSKAQQILLFNQNNYSLNGCLILSDTLINVFQNKIYLHDEENKCLVIYDLQFIMNENLVDSKYLCKINPHKKHLYNNPFFLPCGNSACLECICIHFNINKGSIKCYFETCQQEHILPRKLEKDKILSELIRNDCPVLLKTMIDDENIRVNDRSKFFRLIETINQSN